MKKLARDVYDALQQRLLYHCKHIESARREMAELASAYNRYRHLVQQLEESKVTIFTLLRMLGLDRATQGLPNVDAHLIREKVANPVNAGELAEHLSTWRAVRALLYETDKCQVGEIEALLTELGMEGMSRQRIEAALRRNPNTFEITQKNHKRFVELKPKK